MKNRNSTSLRDAVIEAMRELGLTTLFGIPGSTELEFLHDWREDIGYVLGLQGAVTWRCGPARAENVPLAVRQPPAGPRFRCPGAAMASQVAA